MLSLAGNLLIVIIIAVIILVYYTKKESLRSARGREPMTEIRRGVGFANGNDTPVAAGIVNSAPIMDMTHTYWDGSSMTSCDECPNIESCPRCPQYSQTREGMAADIRTSHDPNILPDYIDGAPNVNSGEGELVQDFEAEFNNSRERMGAHVSKQLCSNRSSIFSDGESLGARSDDQFVDRLTSSRQACKPCDSSTIKMLYRDTMGLDGTCANPSPDQCEYTNEIGYIYKEPCGW